MPLIITQGENMNNKIKITIVMSVILSFMILSAYAVPDRLTYIDGYWTTSNGDLIDPNTIKDYTFISYEPMVMEVTGYRTFAYNHGVPPSQVSKTATFQFSAEPLAGTAYKGNFGWFVSANQRNGGIFGSVAPINNGDEYRWPIEIPAGNYTFVGFFDTANNRGTQEVYINSSTYSKLILSRDGYSSSVVTNAQHRIDFQLSEDVKGNMTYKANGKNSASGSYGLYYSSMVITSRP